MKRSTATLFLALFLAMSLASCTRKASREQCDLLLETYATLYVHEHSPGLPEEAFAAARTKEKVDARNDDNFKNCPSEVSAAEFECAMRAASVALFNKCLE